MTVSALRKEHVNQKKLRQLLRIDEDALHIIRRNAVKPDQNDSPVLVGAHDQQQASSPPMPLLALNGHGKEAADADEQAEASSVETAFEEVLDDAGRPR